MNLEIKQVALGIMRQYGSLPSNAIIAAACKHYDIDTIITFDEDFKQVPWLTALS